MSAKPDLPPLPMREFRAAWIATVDNIDWPSKRTLTTSEAQKELIMLLDRAASMHLNAVILQVRPACDALYASPYEPWSEYLTGKQGKAPTPKWDPLEFAIQEAHERGLELHAWFNPYRAWHPSGKGDPDPTHVSRSMPGCVCGYGKQQWMIPSDPAVRAHSKQVILDVVRRYDIDGVHLDDYFYPYPIAGTVFPDADDYKKYRAKGGKASLQSWRRAAVDGFVSDLYKSIKKEKRWVQVGISPFGIYRPGVPKGIWSSIDQYDDLAADAPKWLHRGWVDYLVPQLYWRLASEKQNYVQLLTWWLKQNKLKRHVWAGNFTSSLASDVGNWPSNEILGQIEATREQTNGNIHFSIKAFTKDYKGIAAKLTRGLYAEMALPPASPWLSSGFPAPPKLSASKSGDKVKITWNGAPSVVKWVVCVKSGKKWTMKVSPMNEILLESGETVAVAALDRVNQMSGWSIWGK